MATKIIIAVVVVLLLGGGAFFLMQNNSQTPATSTPEVTVADEPTAVPSVMSAESTPSGAMEEEGAVKEFTVMGSNYAFAPATMTVKKGDKVRIVFKNSGGMHDFVIDELNLKTKIIQGGTEDTVEFTADQAGTFEYYCSVGNHRQMGMKGTLIVL